MSRNLDLERETAELGVDLALRQIWEILEPILTDAESGGEPIGVPQLACSLRAAYGAGFNDAIRWVEGRSSRGVEPSEPPIR